MCGYLSWLSHLRIFPLFFVLDAPPPSNFVLSRMDDSECNVARALRNLVHCPCTVATSWRGWRLRLDHGASPTKYRNSAYPQQTVTRLHLGSLSDREPRIGQGSSFSSRASDCDKCLSILMLYLLPLFTPWLSLDFWYIIKWGYILFYLGWFTWNCHFYRLKWLNMVNFLLLALYLTK